MLIPVILAAVLSSAIVLVAILVSKLADRERVIERNEKILKHYVMLMTPGEVVDRKCILSLKRKHISSVDADTNKLYGAADRLAGQLMITLSPEDAETFTTLWLALLAVNTAQWAAEDKVREEQSAEAAVEARRWNNKRVAIKNEINDLFHAPCERKKYPDIDDSEKKM
jgi:hypothetical protein